MKINSEEERIERIKGYKKKYRETHREKLLTASRKYHIENKELIKERQKKHDKEYYINNKENIIQKNIERIKLLKQTDEIFKIKLNISSCIRSSFKRTGFTKKSKTTDILGCSINDFKLHIESKFEPWMDWGNKGLYNGTFNYGWDIDHIIPLSTAKTEEDVIKLNHYTNLQPVCSYIIISIAHFFHYYYTSYLNINYLHISI
jgi:hypothetical protein